MTSVIFAQSPSMGKADPISSKNGRKFATLFFTSKIGSFRFVGSQAPDSNHRDLVEGRVEVVFEGTLLINGLKGKVTPMGALRKEFEKDGRVAYFGKGRVIIEGEFWAVQAFGTNIDGRFTGWGVCRLYGEFDENLSTGNFWFSYAPKKQYWSPYGSTFTLTSEGMASPAMPKERKTGGGR